MTFYRDVDPQFCQGDIFDDVPSIHLKSEPPISAIRKCRLKGNREGWEPIAELTGASQSSVKADFKKGEMVPAFCQISRAILITRDCEIDKDPKHRLVALVRPIESVQAEHQETVRQNRNFNCFYLPPDSSRGLAEAYVDLRRLTCLAPEVVANGKRLVSLTDESVAALRAQLFLFLTHREVV